MNATALSRLSRRLRDSDVYRSIVRHGIMDTNRNRSLIVFENVFLHVHPVHVREKTLRFRHTYWLGGVTVVCALVLIVTGVLLMFYYHPAAPHAYRDMKDLQFVVSNGVFLRNLHRLAAHLMVFAVFWHMFHVFYRGGYKPPHEFNWVIGVLLILTTLFLSYTGYLLPWDQLAFWAVTVGTNIISAMPFIGNKIRFLLLGGNIVGENALLRFYVLHVVILPLIAFLFIGIHFWRVQKDGGLTVTHKDEDGKD